MVPKPGHDATGINRGFRAVLFRMVPKRGRTSSLQEPCFRAVLFRMVPKHCILLISPL